MSRQGPVGAYRRKECQSPASEPAQVTHALPRVHERELQRIERRDLIALGLLQGEAIWTAVYGRSPQGTRVPTPLRLKGQDR